MLKMQIFMISCCPPTCSRWKKGTSWKLLQIKRHTFKWCGADQAITLNQWEALPNHLTETYRLQVDRALILWLKRQISGTWHGTTLMPVAVLVLIWPSAWQHAKSSRGLLADPQTQNLKHLLNISPPLHFQRLMLQLHVRRANRTGSSRSSHPFLFYFYFFFSGTQYGLWVIICSVSAMAELVLLRWSLWNGTASITQPFQHEGPMYCYRSGGWGRVEVFNCPLFEVAHESQLTFLHVFMCIS